MYIHIMLPFSVIPDMSRVDIVYIPANDGPTLWPSFVSIRNVCWRRMIYTLDFPELWLCQCLQYVPRNSGLGVCTSSAILSGKYRHRPAVLNDSHIAQSYTSHSTVHQEWKHIAHSTSIVLEVKKRVLLGHFPLCGKNIWKEFIQNIIHFWVNILFFGKT